MRLNELGEIVRDEWLKTAQLRPRVVLDAFVVMPNHIHGIIVLADRRGTLQRAPTTFERFGKPTSDSIPTIVRLFKSATARRINEHRGTPGAPVWQRNYYEHVIRNEDSLTMVRRYIAENPLRWHLDRENPQALGEDDVWNRLFM
jgi:REP element-mobilizing transposase RayT